MNGEKYTTEKKNERYTKCKEYRYRLQDRIAG